MGSRSDSEGRRGHSKKKRSQSRSPSFKRHKKSVRRQHSRSHSRSPTRKHYRSGSSSSSRRFHKSLRHHSKSRSPTRHHSPRRLSKSRSPGLRRTKSKSPRHHHKSRSPRHHSHSTSPTRHINSRSPKHSKSRSPRRYDRKSPVRHRSKSKSPSKFQERHGQLKSKNKQLKFNRDPEVNLSGFEDLTPSEQAKIRTKLALSAAVLSDGVSKESEEQVIIKKSLREQFERAQAIEQINSEDFIQQSFKSKQEIEIDLSNIVLPTEIKTGITSHKAILMYTDSIAHPNLYEDLAEKEERWFRKLVTLRERLK